LFKKLLPLKNSFVSCLVLTVFVYCSCKKSSDQPSWDVDVLAPLIKSNLTINNLVTDSLLKSNPDSSVNIVYTTNLITFSADTLAKVPDTTLSAGFLVNPNYQGGDTIFKQTAETDFKLGSIQLKKALLKSELIQINMQNVFDSTIVFNYKIPGATLNNKPFNITDSILPDSTYNKSFSLAGYTLDLTGLNHASSNALVTATAIFISKKVKSTSASKPYMVITNTIYNTQPAYIRGYLGQSTINVGPEQSGFSLFKAIRSGTLNFPNVNIQIDLENSIGVDADLKIDKITSINSQTGTVDLSSSALINKSININRATETGNPASPVNPSSQLITINSSNSNISAFLANIPDKLAYTLQVTINPLGNISGDNDFIYSGHGLTANMNINIPLSLAATNLTLSDTLLLNLSSIQQEQKVNGGFLYLYVTNGMPFSAGIQIYTLNNKLIKTDSLFIPPNNTILGAPIGTNGKVAQTVATKLTIPVTKAKINNLLSATKALIIARFNTSNQPHPVNIYNYYQLDVKLVADFNYNLSAP